jgi:hypothetical protein
MKATMRMRIEDEDPSLSSLSFQPQPPLQGQTFNLKCAKNSLDKCCEERETVAIRVHSE